MVVSLCMCVSTNMIRHAILQGYTCVLKALSMLIAYISLKAYMLE